MLAEQELRLVAAGIALGTQDRLECPRCNGGSTKEKSLSIAKDELGNVQWFCFRASCGFRGNTGVSWIDREDIKRAQKLHIFKHSKTSIPDDYKESFKKQFGFLPDDLAWTPDLEGRYLQPYKGPNFEHRGYVARSAFDRPNKTKAIAYTEVEDEPFIHWAGTTTNRLIIIVEDWVSAEKVIHVSGKYNGIRAVSLCGTHIDYVRALEISREANECPVMICLDNDATALSFKYVSRFRGVFKKLLVRPLDRDIKDSDWNTISEIIRYGESFNSIVH